MIAWVKCPDCNKRTIHADIDVDEPYAGNRVEPGFAGAVELNSFKYSCHCFDEYGREFEVRPDLPLNLTASSMPLNDIWGKTLTPDEINAAGFGNEVPIMTGSAQADYIAELERIIEEFVLGGGMEEEQREAAAERRWEERSGR